MFSTSVFGLEHGIQPIYRTLSKKFHKGGVGRSNLRNF